MIINKKIAAIAAASAVVLTGSAWAVGASKEPEVVTETQTETKTEPPVTNTKTETKTKTATVTAAPRTETVTRAARSAERNPVAPEPTSAPETNEPSPQSTTAASSAPAAPAGGPWDALAACESGGNWSINSGNGYYGGIQFSAQTWTAFGGAKYAPTANLASKAQQIEIAQKVQQVQGWGAWPSCSAQIGLR